jgi:hypothetical protein
MTTGRRTADGSLIEVAAARQEFTNALAGVELDPLERRTVDWLLAAGDQPTLHALVTIFAKLRADHG